MKTKSNEEAQQWADAMEKRSRELAGDVHVLRIALQNIADATEPSKAFANPEAKALALIKDMARSALAAKSSSDMPPGFDVDEWAAKREHIIRGMRANAKLHAAATALRASAPATSGKDSI